MSKPNAVRVGCYCGWRSRRVQGECACYDENAMYCSCAWGKCPKCKGKVYPVALLVEWGKRDRLEIQPIKTPPVQMHDESKTA